LKGFAMEFLQNLILPQSSEHILLLNILMLLTMLVFIPFTLLVSGNLVLSSFLLFFSKEKPQIMADLMGFMHKKNFIAYILSVLPPFAFLTIFMQLLAETNTKVYPLFLWASLSFLIGTFLYFWLQKIILSSKNSKEIPMKKLILLFVSALLVNLIGVWLIFSAYEGIISIFSRSETAYQLQYLFTIPTFFRVLVFIFLAPAFAASYNIFRMYFTTLLNENTREYAGRLLAQAVLALVAVLPLWAIFAFTMIPVNTLSNGIFALLGITLFLAIALQVIYLQIANNSSSRLSVFGFVLFMITLTTVFAADRLIINNSTSIATQKLIIKAKEMESGH